MSTVPCAPRAIIFEDHSGLAAALTDLLAGRLGYDVVACAGCIEDAIRVAHVERCDVAVVDLDLQGIMAYPALDELIRRGIPYVMATGAMPLDIPVRYLAPLVCKPYSASQLEDAIREACGRIVVHAPAPASITLSVAGRA
jgi:DNA-binding NarL/FixJ family response regulator